MSPVFGPCRGTASCVTTFGRKPGCQRRRNGTTPVVGKAKPENRSALPLPVRKADVFDTNRRDESLSEASFPRIIITATAVTNRL